MPLALPVWLIKCRPRPTPTPSGPANEPLWHELVQEDRGSTATLSGRMASEGRKRWPKAAPKTPRTKRRQGAGRKRLYEGESPPRKGRSKGLRSVGSRQAGAHEVRGGRAEHGAAARHSGIDARPNPSLVRPIPAKCWASTLLVDAHRTSPELAP